MRAAEGSTCLGLGELLRARVEERECVERGKRRGGGERQRGEGCRAATNQRAKVSQGPDWDPGWDPGWGQAGVEAKAARLGSGVTSPSSIAKAASALAPSRMSTA